MARSKNLERLGHRRTVAPPAPGEGVRGYPRPLLRRSEWTSLNGTWDLAIDYDGIRRAPAEIRFDRTIEVPYAVETARSGVADTGLHRAVWYRRAIRCAPPPADHRVILPSARSII